MTEQTNSPHAQRWLAVQILKDVQQELGLAGWSARYDPQCIEDVCYYNGTAMLSLHNSAMQGGDITITCDNWDYPTVATVVINNVEALVNEKHYNDAREVLDNISACDGLIEIREELREQYLDFKKNKNIPPVRHNRDKQHPRKAGRVIRSV